MRARHVLSLILLVGALISSCLGNSGGGGTGRVQITGQDAGQQLDAGQGAAMGANLGGCRPCSRSSQCASHFCNRLDGSNDGRCSEPGDNGVCNCEQGVLVNGQVCTGSDCPAGDPVLLNCEQLTGEAVPVVAGLPDGGAAIGGSGGAGGSGGSAGAGGATGGVGGVGGAGGIGGAGGTPQINPSALGAGCSSDAECESGLICLEPDGSDWFSGGPSNGYCTLGCSVDPTVCDPFDALCVTGEVPAESYCFESCTSGGALAKCHARPDSACIELAPGQSVCLPTCGSDDQCPAGRYCDMTQGVCVDTQPTGDPMGAPCSLANDTCAGFCGDFGNGLTVCTGFCTVGLQYPGCGMNPADAVSPGDPMCLPVFGQTDGLNDTGLCIQRCDCNDHCSHPATVCLPLDNPASEEAFGALGLCAEDDLVSPNLACGDAGP